LGPVTSELGVIIETDEIKGTRQLKIIASQAREGSIMGYKLCWSQLAKNVGLLP
jgi:hypothetical protein